MIRRTMKSSLSGFTLIELMITLAITGFLALGAATFFSSADRSNRVQSAMSGMNTSGRFGLDQIARDLRMSGYRDSDWTAGPLTNVVVVQDGAAATGGDTVQISYEAARDCNFAPAVGGLVTNTYRVVNGALECNDQEVTDGVEQLQIWLGEDIDNDGVANRWLAPGTVGLDMTRIVAIRSHLLVRSQGSNINTNPQAFYYNNQQQVAVQDGQIRREYTITVALRNPS